MNQRVHTRRFFDWESFLDHARTIDNVSGMFRPKVLFRGQSDPNWQIESTWSRKRKSVFYSAGEANSQLYLSRFKEAIIDSRQDLSLDSLTDDQIWAIGRHYGLITPLIDWSESVYIATYFAAMDFWTRNCLEEGVYDIGKHLCKPFAVYSFCPGENSEKYGLRIFQGSSSLSYRRRRQMGWFSVQEEDSDISLDEFVNTGERLKWSLDINKYLLPSHIVESVLSDLYRMGIHTLSMFDDIEGAIHYSNWDYKRFSPSHVWTTDPVALTQIENEWGSDFIARWK